MLEITAKLLEEKGACHVPIILFRNHFGEGPAPLTREAVLAVAREFNWDWAAGRLFPDVQWNAYVEAVTPHRKAYFEAVKPYDEVYDEAIAKCTNMPGDAIKPHRVAYFDAIRPHWKLLDEARALAFLEQALTV